jgi:hypothetical protein
MNNNAQENNLKLSIEYVSENSNNSVDDDDNFQTSAKLISLNQMGLSVEKIQTNPKKKRIIKKNTRVSSNVEEDLYEGLNENENENENYDNKFLHLNIENNQNILQSDEKQFHLSDNNLKLLKLSNLSTSNPNFNDFNINDNKFNSENSNILMKNTNNNSTEYTNKKNPNVNLMRVSSFSPTKKKKKLVVLEEKQKTRGRRRSIYAVDPKEEVIEEEKKSLRKDYYGTPICKKNKKKVKVTFKKDFEIVTPIESFKKYNVTIGIPKGEKYINRFDNCQCCAIF